MRYPISRCPYCNEQRYCNDTTDLIEWTCDCVDFLEHKIENPGYFSDNQDSNEQLTTSL